MPTLRLSVLRQPAAALACAAGLLAGAPAHADLKPAGYYLQLGAAEQGTQSVTGGLIWPWASRWNVLGGQVGGYWEGYASVWRARGFPDHQHYLQVALVPMVRYRFDQGQSPWFVEGGIGISFMESIYRTPHKTFSTTFQFSDNIAVGRSFGEGNRSDISLRIQHISNASIKRPNPGENFLQIRYATGF